MLKMSADGGHFEPRSGSLNTILEVDHLAAMLDFRSAPKTKILYMTIQ